MLRERLAMALPIEVSARSLCRWFLFTDSACEPEDGPILYGATGTACAAFSASVPPRIMEGLLSESKTRYINWNSSPCSLHTNAVKLSPT